MILNHILENCVELFSQKLFVLNCVRFPYTYCTNIEGPPKQYKKHIIIVIFLCVYIFQFMLVLDIQIYLNLFNELTNQRNGSI